MKNCLCCWQSCTNGCPNAPTWLPPSGRAWDCWWAWARCWRGLPQGRLKTWLWAHQNWQRNPGLLPWAEAPSPLLLSHRGDPLGVEHSTVIQDGKCNRGCNKQEHKRWNCKREQMLLTESLVILKWKAPLSCFHVCQNNQQIIKIIRSRKMQTNMMNDNYINSIIWLLLYHNSLLAFVWMLQWHLHGTRCQPQTSS